MKILISSIFLAVPLTAYPAPAAKPKPCEIAQKKLEFNYAYLSPKSAQEIKACVSKNSICVLNDDETVIGGQSPKDVAKQSVVATFGMYQPNSSTCLLGEFSGGSAAAWLFKGWRTNSGRPIAIKSFENTQLNSDAVSPADLIKVMSSALSRQLETKITKKS